MNTAIKMKACSNCGRHLPLSAFHRRRHYVRSGYRAACKDCTRKATRKARVGRSVRRTAAERQKAKVRARTREAVRTGLLAHAPCEVCGAKNVDPHHATYEGMEAHLEVEWLCRKDHALIHGTRAWTKQLELIGEAVEPSEPVEQLALFEE